MTRISDALELLTAQHGELEALLATVVTSPSSGARDAAFDQLADQLSTHLAAEQMLLYPAITASVSDRVMQEILAEHREIKRALADLLWFGLDDDRAPQRLRVLAALLDGHSAWQEEQLFMVVAETRSLEDLAELGAQLHSFGARTGGLAAAA